MASAKWLAAGIVLCLIPMHAAQEGSGTVVNIQPTTLAVSNEGPYMTAGGPDTISGSVEDQNGWQEIHTLVFASMDHVLPMVEQPVVSPPSAEPADFTDGWKIWNDGTVVHFQYRLVYPEDPGFYVFSVFGVDEEGPPAFQHTYQTPDGDTVREFASPNVQVRTFRPLHVEPEPVSYEGMPMPGSWGEWQARPGQSWVPSSNFLKVVNGPGSDVNVVLDFSDIAFRAGSGAAIGIDSNIHFWALQAREPWSESPFEADEGGQYQSFWDGTMFTGIQTSPTGSIELHFADPGAVQYVTYGLAQMSLPLPDGRYTAPYTLTEV